MFQPADGEERDAARELANLAILKRNALEELLADDDNEVEEADRPVMMTCLDMTQTEFELLETLIRVTMRLEATSSQKSVTHRSRGS